MTAALVKDDLKTCKAPYDIVLRKVLRIGKFPLRCFMKDDIDGLFGKHRSDGLFITDVAFDAAGFVGNLRKGSFGKVIKSRDLMACFKQGFDKAGPDKAGASRN